MSVLERISVIILNENLSVRKFDISIGKKNGYTASLKMRNGTPSATVIAEIHKVYPKYSLEWLISGEGDWLKENTGVNEPPASYSKTASITINIVDSDEQSELFEDLEKLIQKHTKNK